MLEELNQPDSEEEVIGNGKRLEQQNGDGGRFGVIANHKDRQKVADETEQTNQTCSNSVNGEGQRHRAVQLSQSRRR